MKEATGNLNMAIVVAVSIALLSAFFFGILWPNIRDSFVAHNKCSNAVCDPRTLQDGSVTCVYYDNHGRQQGGSFACVWKG